MSLLRLASTDVRSRTEPLRPRLRPAPSIFLINLAKSKDRLAFMAAQITDGFHRIEAATGDTVPRHFVCQFASSHRLTPGERGCYASHLIAAEQIIARGLSCAVILEDDVELDDGFLDDVIAAIEAAPRPWDVIGLAWLAKPRHRKLAPVGRRHLVQFLHMPKVTAAYVLSYAGALKMLAPRPRLRPVDVDIHYGWEMRLNGYGVCPQPARQAGLPSTISVSGGPERSRGWRPPLHRYLWGRGLMALKMIAPKLPRAASEFASGVQDPSGETVRDQFQSEPRYRLPAGQGDSLKSPIS